MASITLTDEEIEQYISEIVSGLRLVKVNSDSGTSRFILLRHPTTHERRIANIMYQESLEQAKKDGLRTRKELEIDFLKKNDIYTYEDEIQEARLREEIKVQYKILKMAKEEYKIKYKENLKKSENKYYEFISKKLKYDVATAEAVAEIHRSNYYTYCCAIDFKSNEAIWNDYDSFEKCDDAIFSREIRYEVKSFLSGIPGDILRTLARSGQWRSIWNIAVKTGAPLFGIPMQGGKTVFGGPVAEWTIDQIQLSNWSIFYSNIEGSMEPPPEHVLNDDDLLDKYVQKQIEQREKERLKNLGSSRGAYDHQDVIILDQDEKEFLFPKNED